MKESEKIYNQIEINGIKMMCCCNDNGEHYKELYKKYIII